MLPGPKLPSSIRPPQATKHPTKWPDFRHRLETFGKHVSCCLPSKTAHFAAPVASAPSNTQDPIATQLQQDSKPNPEPKAALESMRSAPGPRETAAQAPSSPSHSESVRDSLMRMGKLKEQLKPIIRSPPSPPSPPPPPLPPSPIDESASSFPLHSIFNDMRKRSSSAKHANNVSGSEDGSKGGSRSNVDTTYDVSDATFERRKLLSSNAKQKSKSSRKSGRNIKLSKPQKKANSRGLDSKTIVDCVLGIPKGGEMDVTIDDSHTADQASMGDAHPGITMDCHPVFEEVVCPYCNCVHPGRLTP